MNKTKELTVASMCLALGVILPQAFHMVPNAGVVFLPMHIPVLICGFICSPIYAFLVGLLTPFISHIIFQMPPTPMLGQMLIELSVYGLAASLLTRFVKVKNDYLKTYICLILTMIIGRVTYGICNALIFKAGAYSFQIWLTAAFVSALPGIIIQLIVIPIIVVNARKIVKN